MTLYSLAHSGDQYRITKWDNDLNVESSYLCTFDECECPAGHRPSCRHRQMLPVMIARDAIGNGVYYDYDTDQFYQPINHDVTSEALPETVEPHSTTASAPDFDSGDTGSNPVAAAIDIQHETYKQLNEFHNECHPTIGPIKRRI